MNPSLIFNKKCRPRSQSREVKSVSTEYHGDFGITGKLLHCTQIDLFFRLLLISRRQLLVDEPMQ